MRGYWWSPDGTAIAACRVDVAEVRHVAHRRSGQPVGDTERDPLPGAPARRTPTCACSSVPSTASERIEVVVGPRRAPLPRRRDVGPSRPATSRSQSRDQRRRDDLQADPATGSDDGAARPTTTTTGSSSCPGTPRHDADGRLVTCGDRDGVRRLLVDDVAVTPTDQQVRAVVVRRRQPGRQRRHRLPRQPHRGSDRAARLAAPPRQRSPRPSPTSRASHRAPPVATPW